jgi:hypothetical protein
MFAFTKKEKGQHSMWKGKCLVWRVHGYFYRDIFSAEKVHWGHQITTQNSGDVPAYSYVLVIFKNRNCYSQASINGLLCLGPLGSVYRGLTAANIWPYQIQGSLRPAVLCLVNSSDSDGLPCVGWLAFAAGSNAVHQSCAYLGLHRNIRVNYLSHCFLLC